MTPHRVGLAVVALAGTTLFLAETAAGEPAPPTPPSDTPAPKGREIDLRPKFKPGQEIRFKLELRSRELTAPNPKAPPAGGKAPTPSRPKSDPAPSPGRPATTGESQELDSFRQEVVVKLKVTGVDRERGTSADLVFESFKMAGTTAVGPVDFDSAKPARKDNPIDEALRGIVGTTLEVTFDRDGNMTDARPKAVPGKGDDLSAMLSGVLTGGDVVKSLLGPTVSAGARTSARVGERWTEQSRMGATGGTWTLNVTKTLSVVRGGVAVIDMTGAVTLDPSSQGGAGSGSLGVDATSTYRGTCEWDVERGMVRRVESILRVRSKAPEMEIGEQTHEERVSVTRLGS